MRKLKKLLLIIILSINVFHVETAATNILEENGKKAAELYVIANKYLENRDYDNAIKTYKQAIFIDSTNAKYYWRLGNAYSAFLNKSKDYKQAIAAYKKAIYHDSTKATYYYSLGRAYSDNANNFEDMKLSINAFKTAIKLDPDDIIYRLSLASGYEKIKDMDKALIEYNSIIRIKPKDEFSNFRKQDAYVNACALLIKINKPAEAANLYKQLIETYPDNADNYCHLAKYYVEQKQYSLAIETYKKALKLDSGAICDIELGKLYCTLGKYYEAIDVFKKAIVIEPKYVAAYFNLGQAYYLLEMYQDAITAFLTTVTLKKDYAEAYFRLGLSYGRIEQYSDAISAYEKAVEISPDDYSSYFNIGINYNRLNSPADAVIAFKKAAQILPEEPKVHYNLGITYADLGDHENAFAEYQILRPLNDSLATELSNRITTVKKGIESLHFSKAVKLIKTGLYNEALNEFTSSIEKNEGKTEAYLYRGGILLEKKEYEGALYNLNQAEKLGVTNWVLHYWRADVFSYQKEFRLVVKDLNKALSLLPASEVETRKEIEWQVKFIQSALDIPGVGEFLADPNKQPARQQPTYTPRKAPQFDFNFQNNTQPTQPRNQVREKETCSFCNGTGEGMQCYSCNGTGIKTENCFSCNGTGRGYSGNKCISCDGRGFKNSRCYFCNGKGHKPCTYCNGRGVR